MNDFNEYELKRIIYAFEELAEATPKSDVVSYNFLLGIAEKAENQLACLQITGGENGKV